MLLMNAMVKRIPIPIAGLALALAAMGNLVASYGEIYRKVFGILSFGLICLLLAKIIIMPKSLNEGFNNPLVASVMPTFSMALIILSTYIKPYSSGLAFGIWLLGLGIHTILIICFTKKYIFNFKMENVFPSYFIVYVGVVTGSITAPAFGLPRWGQAIFWFGFIMYLVLLLPVAYRVVVKGNIGQPAIPSMAIFAAPASLCLAGYLNSFQDKSMGIIGFLAALSILMFLAVMIYVPRMLRLKFYPSYSALTFPFVITAIAIKGVNNFFANTGISISVLPYLVKFLELWSTVMVLYVLIKYLHFILAEPKSTGIAVK